MLDFAFFVVNFGYSRADYDQLTLTERVLIKKAYEEKTVTQTTLTRDAVLNAITNANRKRGKKFRPLWKKKAAAADKESIRKKISDIREIEREEKGWVRMIYTASRGRLKRKGAGENE